MNTLLLNEEEVKSTFKEKTVAIDLVEYAFHQRSKNAVLLPNKISQIFDEKTQNRINCMPATLINEKICGVKWVSVFPPNPQYGYKNVSGMIILSEIEHGFPIAVMDGTYITSIRTASVGAVAAKYLARDNSESIGFIGAGSEARKHLEMIKLVRPNINKCYVSSRTEKTVKDFIKIESKQYPDIIFVNCGDDYKSAVVDSDIIVTATSTQKDLLKAKWIKEGALYIHVGGWEDEFAVPLKADKIICDEWENVKHRSQTLSRMFKAGLLNDEKIYANLGEIISGKAVGRQNDKEFIYFNSVGLAFIDMVFAKHVYDRAFYSNIGNEFCFMKQNYNDDLYD